MDEIVAVTFTEKAAGELKLRLREALEQRARERAQDATVRERLEHALDDARGSARQHHSRLLRRAAARAAGRGVRRSAVRRADRAAGRPAVSRARFAPGCRRRCSDPPEGLRRALRRTSAPAFGGGDADGPIDRLRGAGRTLAEWRDFPQPWQRPPFDRAREIDRLVVGAAPPRGSDRVAAVRSATTCTSTPTRCAG